MNSLQDALTAFIVQQYGVDKARQNALLVAELSRRLVLTSEAANELEQIATRIAKQQIENIEPLSVHEICEDKSYEECDAIYELVLSRAELIY